MVSIRLYAVLLLSLIIKTDYYSQELVSEGDAIKVSPSAVLQERFASVWMSRNNAARKLPGGSSNSSSLPRLTSFGVQK